MFGIALFALQHSSITAEAWNCSIPLQKIFLKYGGQYFTSQANQLTPSFMQICVTKAKYVINLTDNLKRKEEKKNQWLNYKPDYEK